MIGGFAANTAEIITFPIDNIKTRMQMNGREGCKTLYYIKLLFIIYLILILHIKLLKKIKNL